MKNMTDVFKGKITLIQLNREIIRHMTSVKKISRLVVDIKRESDGYHTTIWIPISDFNKGVPK